MKKIIILIVLFVSDTILSQTVFDKFENQEQVATVIVNKKMFSLLSEMAVNDAASQQYVNLIKKLDNLKVFVTGNQKIAADMKSVSGKYVKSAGLAELLKESAEGKTISIYVKKGAAESQIKEMLMFVDGKANEDTILMVLSGNFDLDEVSLLTDKMNLPGGNDLKKASKTEK
ncbi:MAG: DUF4252 domain-containing protein [Flavobacterium sp.]